MKYIILILIVLVSCTKQEHGILKYSNKPVFSNINLKNYLSINEALASDDVKNGDVLYLSEGTHFEEIINISKDITIVSFNNSTIVGRINIIDNANCIFKNLTLGIDPESEFACELFVEKGQLTIEGLVTLNGKGEVRDRMVVPIGSDFVTNTKK